MKHYIDRDTLVVEIEKLENTYKKCPTRNSYEEGLKDGRLIGYKDALHKIDTLEVKEVEEEPVSEWVEAEINYWIQRGLSIRLEDKYLEDLGFEEGDKVKVIIVKLEP